VSVIVVVIHSIVLDVVLDVTPLLVWEHAGVHIVEQSEFASHVEGHASPRVVVVDKGCEALFDVKSACFSSPCVF